jgi:hypothetical protein
MGLIAYHGDPSVKIAALAQIRAHAAADELVKGQYWENGKGCAVGCQIHSSDHAQYEIRFGIPQILAQLEDTIFEGLPNGDAQQWPERFMQSIQPGADLSRVAWQFLHWLLTDRAVNPGIDHVLVRDTVKQCADALLIMLTSGAPVDANAAGANAANAANAAREAESAAREAESAAANAAWTAAGAESAAGAAWTAAGAAGAAANAARANAAREAESAAGAAWTAAGAARTAANAARANAAREAESAASVAWTAAGAARAGAARAAESAAESAARTAAGAAGAARAGAARAAESAAGAAWTAAGAAGAARAGAAYQRMADKMIDLIIASAPQ